MELFSFNEITICPLALSVVEGLPACPELVAGLQAAS
jgi:hypothetical protein